MVEGDDGSECTELPKEIQEIHEYGWPFVEIDEVLKNPRGVNNKNSFKGVKRTYA